MEFRAFLDRIEAVVPAELDVHLIMDDYGTLKIVLIKRWLAKRPRFHIHFTPTSASWLNLIERWFVALTEKQIRRRAPPEHTGARDGHPSLHRTRQPGSQTLHLDQDRRSNPGQHCAIL